MSVDRLVELSSRIARNTVIVSDHLSANNLLPPSYGVGAGASGAIPDIPEIEASRLAVIQDTQELRELMLNPREYLLGFVHNTMLPQQGVTRFGLARSFPVGEETTFGAMAAATGLDERNVRKVVRYAVAQRIFTEPRPGVVAHSPVSRLLAEDPGFHDYVATCSDELWPAAAQTCNAMAKWPGSEEVTQTGFSLANQTDKPMYEYLSRHPERARRFANTMRTLTTGKGFELQHVTDNFPWGALGNGTVVDVGGSQGFVCVALARKFPSLSFIVQDLESVVEESRGKLPVELADRITFATHDFFSVQPVHGADVYFFRWIFHNWPDKYCVQILRNLMPALKPGARIVISEMVVPEPGSMPKAMAMRMRSFDLVMTALQNASERALADWEQLFRMADERFEFQGATQPPGSNSSILVAEWKGD